jgi:hypothetical protein
MRVIKYGACTENGLGNASMIARSGIFAVHRILQYKSNVGLIDSCIFADIKAALHCSGKFHSRTSFLSSSCEHKWRNLQRAAISKEREYVEEDTTSL